MTSKIVAFLIVIIAVALILYVASRTIKDKFYDGAVFDYTQPDVYDYDFTGVYYENGAPFGSSEFHQRMLGWKAAEIKLAAEAADAYALRKMAMVHEAKRKAAEYRELAAERDMTRERTMKLAAEAEVHRMMMAAKCHDKAAKEESRKLLEFKRLVKESDAKIASLSKEAMDQASIAKQEKALTLQTFSHAPIPGSCRTMLMTK